MRRPARLRPIGQPGAFATGVLDRSALRARAGSAVAILLLGSAATGAGAQGTVDPGRQRADSLIEAASHLSSAGDTSGALRVLAAATRAAPNYARAYYERGTLLTRSSQLGVSDLLRRREAKKMVMRALDLDANNPLYLIELGRLKQKTPMLRLDAERMFKRAEREAIARGDSGVLAEVEWELGLIHERRYQSGADRRMVTGDARNFDVEQASADWQYTAHYIESQTVPLEDTGEADRRLAEQHYRAALAADPTHAGATDGLFSLLYSDRRFEELARVAADAARAQPRSARARMALGLALHRIDRDAEAERAFDEGLALMPAEIRADMTDLAQILPTREAAGYRALGAPARAEFDRLFWTSADPLHLTPENEARVEFLARVTWAALRYSSDEFEAQGWRTDRGQIVIRYGEPPVAMTLAPEVGLSSGEAGRVTTVWYYPEAKHSFVFIGPPAMNTAFFAGDFAGIAEDMRINQPARFNNLPSLRVDSLPVQVARFRGQAAGRVDVLVAADVPTARLLAGSDLARASREDAFTITTPDGRDALRSIDTSAVRGAGASVSPRSWQRELPVGNYAYRVESRVPASGRGARARAGLTLVPFPAGVVSSSDLLVARRLTPLGNATPRSLADFALVPDAALAYRQDDTLHVYWETYGLHADSAGTGRYRVELALTLAEVDRGPNVIVRAFGGVLDATGLTARGDTRSSIRFDRTVPVDVRDRTPNFLSLDLHGAPPGTYQLSIRTTDLVSGQSTERERTIRVLRP